LRLKFSRMMPTTTLLGWASAQAVASCSAVCVVIAVEGKLNAEQGKNVRTTPEKRDYSE
jgi:hypothetical protein